jgi:hypothetical protein
MSEPSITQKLVSLNGGINVIFMDADRDSHEQVLGSFNNGVIDFQ